MLQGLPWVPAGWWGPSKDFRGPPLLADFPEGWLSPALSHWPSVEAWVRQAESGSGALPGAEEPLMSAEDLTEAFAEFDTAPSVGAFRAAPVEVRLRYLCLDSTSVDSKGPLKSD